tara:strand:- start:1 stop:180 length:180 start_codon:yes stop_codon:yes gene_type:complete
LNFVGYPKPKQRENLAVNKLPSQPHLKEFRQGFAYHRVLGVLVKQANIHFTKLRQMRVV